MPLKPLAVVLLVSGLVVALAGGPALSAPVPATAPAAKEVLAKLEQKYGDGYQYEVDEGLKIVFATNVDRATLAALRTRLTAHTTALQRDLFSHGLAEYLTVVIPKEWRGSGGGFFTPAEHSVRAKNTGAPMIHEFTHALHFADQEARHQEHMTWVIEGLAALFETSEIVDGHAVPGPNYRLKIIQNLVKDGKHVPWGEYVGFDQRKFMTKPGFHYSQARYMFMFLYDKHLLRAWYDAYTAGFEKDRTGAAAFETVFRKKLPEVEKEWAAWVLTLPLPPAEKPKGSAEEAHLSAPPSAPGTGAPEAPGGK